MPEEKLKTGRHAMGVTENDAIKKNRSGTMADDAYERLLIIFDGR